MILGWNYDHFANQLLRHYAPIPILYTKVHIQHQGKWNSHQLFLFERNAISIFTLAVET